MVFLVVGTSCRLVHESLVTLFTLVAGDVRVYEDVSDNVSFELEFLQTLDALEPELFLMSQLVLSQMVVRGESLRADVTN